ncbi:hypothetical protein B6D29_03800 [Microgenomates bacterium UTCPR1]|nr:MAG: hypothetical protein B6D29_03800 [Microgenomates bacterium UTCPR1]
MKKIILGISGSLRKESYSTKLLKAFGELAPDDVDFRIADISRFPVFNQDDEMPEPDFLVKFKEMLKPVHGVLFVTPEHNRSFPAALKNVLDWVSRPQVPAGTGSWAGKVAGIAGITPYTLGAVSAVMHLRQVIMFLNMPVLQQPEFYLTFAENKFDRDGKLVDENTKEHIRKFWKEYLALVDKINS